MGAATQLTDFSDLYTDLQNRVRVNTGVTATENQAKRYINIALADMHIGFGEKVPWAERTAVLVTNPPYSTGTLAVTKGATTLTGTGTAWDSANDWGVNNMRVGGKILIAGHPEVYEITAIASDTSATIGTLFIDTTETAATYVYYEDDYALAGDFLRPVDAEVFDTNDDISIISRTDFRRRYPRNSTRGKPRVVTIVDKPFSGNTTRVRKVRMHQPPDAVYQIPYAYVTDELAVSSSGTAQTQLSADADEPIVPLQYRHVIVFHALYHWYRDKKDDDRSEEAKAEYVELMLRITGDSEIGSPRPQIRPRLASYARAARRPYSGKGRRHTIGTAFDELRDR